MEGCGPVDQLQHGVADTWRVGARDGLAHEDTRQRRGHVTALVRHADTRALGLAHLRLPDTLGPAHEAAAEAGPAVLEAEAGVAVVGRYTEGKINILYLHLFRTKMMTDLPYSYWPL